VLQTIFLRLLRQSDQTRKVENEEGYLRRAAINASLDVVRSRQADRTLELVDVEDGNRHGETADLRQALARAMSTLQPRQAEVFILRFLEGLSNKEIARMLGISQVLVAVIVHRTRQQLRKELGKYRGDRS